MDNFGNSKTLTRTMLVTKCNILNCFLSSTKLKKKFDMLLVPIRGSENLSVNHYSHRFFVSKEFFKIDTAKLILSLFYLICRAIYLKHLIVAHN